MHVLVAVIGTYGDVAPFIAIGAELRRRGHRVTFATANTFEIHARRAGLDFEPLMTAAEHAAFFSRPELWRPLRGFRHLFAATEHALRPTYDFILRHHRRGETIVVASTLAVGARVASDAGIGPLVSVHMAPIMMQSRFDAPRMPGFPVPNWLPGRLKWTLQLGADKHFIDPLFVPKLNAFRTALGLRPVRRLRHWWHSRHRVILMFPEWFARRQPDWPEQAVQAGFARADAVCAATEGLASDLRTFLDAGDPPVVVTFGSTVLHERAFYETSVAACARLGRRCVLLAGHPVAAPPGMEGRVFVTPYAALSALLPRSAALVHHGGVGTLSQAFAAGVPQVIVPTAYDQFDNAERVRRLGCGVWLRRRRYTAGRAARVLALALGSAAMAARCREVAGACKQGDAIGSACTEIEMVFRSKRTAARPAPT